MDHNHSPWISELKKDRIPHTHDADNAYDVAVVGGGIAGMATAYYILKHTRKSVILVEASRIAHGATGHNGGQAVDYFEKPFSQIVEEYGLEMSVAAQKGVTGALELIEEIIKDTHMDIAFSRFIGYAGFTDMNQVLANLEYEYLKHTGGIEVTNILLAQELITKNDIPDKYWDFCTFVPHVEILKKLETTNGKYVGLLQSNKGTLNSALFVERLSEYLLSQYTQRFAIREYAPVTEAHLYADRVSLQTIEHTIDAEYMVQCTNGFENIDLINHTGLDVNSAFHRSVTGVIGYMMGYFETRNMPPSAICYYPATKKVTADDPYYYVTWRNHVWEEIEKTLVCIGGPVEVHDEVRNYPFTSPYAKTAFTEIDTFIKETYPVNSSQAINYVFKWHGLMGYTRSGLRIIGPEPANSRLLYNLGCNGVGILPSIYGAHKIARHIAGESVAPSIFDPIIQKTVLMQKN